MESKAAVIGIDIGGTYTKLGVVARSGEMLSFKRFPSRANQPFEVFLRELKNALQEVKAELPDEVILKGIGIGAPVANYSTGEMGNASNFKWGTCTPLAKSVKEVSGLPVHIQNDASVAALGELRFGGAKGMKNFVVVTLGTGVGGGFFVNGTLHSGSRGMGGEIGHTIIVRNGRQCPCGLKGCLEVYSSVTGTVISAKNLLASTSAPSSLRDIPIDQLEGRDIFEAAKKQDDLAIEAFRIAGEMLGYGLADVVAYFEPEAIFITGGLAKAGDMVLLPTIQYMEENVFNIFQNQVKVSISSLVNKEGAVLGAAALAWDELN